MEPKFQTSFIPKKPIVTSGGVAKKSIDFFAVIATILFLGSIVLAGSVYVWKYTLEKKVASSEANLVKAREQFDQEFIGYVNRLNTRIETSKELLNNHVGASTIFGLLSSHTLKTVSYSDFSYTLDKDKTIKVILKGTAKSYSSIALQSEEFGLQNQYIKSPIFSDLNPDATGNVAFTLTAFLDKNLISYQKNLEGENTFKNTETPTPPPTSNNTNQNI